MIKMKGIILFLLLLFIRSAIADENEERIITNLRELAARLGWPQDIFIGLRTQDKDVKIFGIADIPISDLNKAPEKSYLQWVFGHRFPLEKILERHLKNYQRLGFQILPIEGLGEKAYRAYALSYVFKNPQHLELSYAQDAVEILSQKNLITLKDERLNLDADAWAIFEEVYRIAAKERFIEPLPHEFLEGFDLKNTYPELPRKINLPSLFPRKKDLPIDPQAWKISTVVPKDKRGEIISLSRKYRFIKGSTSMPEVVISLYAYSSSTRTDISFKRYLKKIKPHFLIQYDEENKSASLISEKGLEKNRTIFAQNIFICDLEIVWNGVETQERRKLLNSFSALLQKRIEKVFPKS